MGHTVTVYRHKESGEIFGEDYLSEQLDELIDESGPVTILGMDFDRSRLIKEADPIAYRQAFLDYVNNDYEEFEVPWEVYVDNDNDGIREWIEQNGEAS